MIEIFSWSDKDSVGIKEIDEQHKQLMGILNELGTALLEFKAPEVIDAVFEKVFDYTREHFATEERLFKKYNYPEEEKHKVEHDQMIAKVAQFKKEYDRGNKMIGTALMDFLKQWCKDHMKVTDYRYISFFKELGVTRAA